MLRSAATAQGLQVINSVDPCVLKSNYYVSEYLQLYDMKNTYRYVHIVTFMQIIQDLVLIMATFAATLVNVLDRSMSVTHTITAEMGRMK